MREFLKFCVFMAVLFGGMAVASVLMMLWMMMTPRFWMQSHTPLPADPLQAWMCFAASIGVVWVTFKGLEVLAVLPLARRKGRRDGR